MRYLGCFLLFIRSRRGFGESLMRISSSSRQSPRSEIQWSALIDNIRLLWAKTRAKNLILRPMKVNLIFDTERVSQHWVGPGGPCQRCNSYLRLEMKTRMPNPVYYHSDRTTYHNR